MTSAVLEGERMHILNRRHGLRLAGVAALLGLATLAAAPLALADNAWPQRPITFVIPGAAGGTTDTPARFLAQKLGERLGQPIVVDNKPGAGGMLGTGLVARAQPDGYTVLVGNTGSNASTTPPTRSSATSLRTSSR